MFCTAELDVADEHEFAYWLAARLGLRRGEVCGLSWEDVDEGAQTVSINHSYDSRRNLKDTKTAAGRRILPLTDDAAEAFQVHRDRQLTKGLPAGPEDPVVITRSGTRVHPDILEKWWKRERGHWQIEYRNKLWTDSEIVAATAAAAAEAEEE